MLGHKNVHISASKKKLPRPRINNLKYNSVCWWVFTNEPLSTYLIFLKEPLITSALKKVRS